MIDKVKIESVAIEAYSKHCKKGSPAKMLPKILAAENVKLREIDGYEKFLGAFLKQPNGQPYIFVNKNIDNVGRKNSTLAHELGHFILQHYLHTASFFCVENDIKEDGEVISEQEKEANYFASCFLLPRDRVFRKVSEWYKFRISPIGQVFMHFEPHGKSFSNWKAISSNLMKNFIVSEVAVKIRLTELGLAKFDF